MYRFLLYTVVLLSVLPSVSVRGEAIYELIESGKLDEARQALSRVSSASLRDGNHLFFQALLEPNGARASELMEVALASSVDVQYREIIHFRLAQYYHLSGAWEKLGKLTVNYRSKFENGQYRSQMMRYLTLLDEHSSAGESALRQADRYLLENNSGEARQWGEIDKARVLLANNKGIGADKMLRDLSKEKSGPGVPQALYLLTMDAMNAKRADDAVFYYNVLREAYPGSVGEGALVDRLGDMSGTIERHTAEAERITGTYYSVQIGVFSDARNARTVGDVFTAEGYDVDIVDRTISRTKYRVVYVGRFKSYAEAAAEKARLEAEFKESYQVVAR